MKIAFATEHFTDARGGAEGYIRTLAQYLLSEGHELTVFYSGDVQSMPSVRLERLLLTKGKSPQERFSNALQDVLLGRKFNVVQAFNHAHPADVLMLHGGVHRAFEKYNAQSAPTALARFLKRLNYRVARKYCALRSNEDHQFLDDPTRRFIAVSERVARDMRQYYPEVGGRIIVINNGVDVERFSPEVCSGHRQQERDKLGLNDGNTVFLFVSNNFRLKGLNDLLAAMPEVLRELPDAVLLIAGSDRPGRYAAQARKLMGSVRFVGRVEDIRGLYAAADLLVHPSYYDSFGGVCLEAMACGLPVVVSRNCGAAFIMENEQGLIDMPCEASVLSQAMIKCTSVKARARARVEHPAIAARYPVINAFSRVGELYDEIAGK